MGERQVPQQERSKHQRTGICRTRALATLTVRVVPTVHLIFPSKRHGKYAIGSTKLPVREKRDYLGPLEIFIVRIRKNVKNRPELL